jgi:hypothetical protein
LFLSSNPARAQAPAEAAPESSRTTARDVGDDALRLFASGMWKEAYEAFRQADMAFHAPTLVLFMAHSQKHLGKLVAARALYQKVVDERIPPTAPLQFITAQVVAREELEHINEHVPFLELALVGDSVDAARVTVDGESAAAVRWQKVPLDPGTHVVEVRVGEAAPIRRELNLKDGAVIRLEIPLLDPSRDTALNASRRGPLAPALAAFGVSAAAFGVGAATGAMALGEIGNLRALCGPSRSCPASAQPVAASAGRLANASTIAFVAGGAVLATGVVLLVVRPGGARAGGASPHVQVGLGLQSAFVAGRF